MVPLPMGIGNNSRMSWELLEVYGVISGALEGTLTLQDFLTDGIGKVELRDQ